MMWMWLQIIVILALAYGMGLLIGGFLGRLALTQLQEKAHPPKPQAPAVARTLTLAPEPEPEVTPEPTPQPKVMTAPEQEAIPADYHGYAPEITPLLTPRLEDLVTPTPSQFNFEAAPPPVKTKPKVDLLFPTSSFGVMSETIKRAAPTISPLAGLDAKALEAVLSNVTEAVEPTRLMAAPADKDDLKLIDGIGPVNEAELHELGIYYFEQIASWSAEEVVWIAQHIHFPDRIVRENWIKQAANLSLSA